MEGALNVAMNYRVHLFLVEEEETIPSAFFSYDTAAAYQSVTQCMESDSPLRICCSSWSRATQTFSFNSEVERAMPFYSKKLAVSWRAKPPKIVGLSRSHGRFLASALGLLP
ncbi:hypothetical protein DBV15_06778 [Temnothorax longispinosus]|uniref:Uncharacterized protein n=1 Tax=Temnothorax longispinosus TaxID=300112 RepID=A0A4S2KY60_9HYME|nr:hypothetical protein DBV15_06778 [Temnothorax longispinosus]